MEIVGPGSDAGSCEIKTERIETTLGDLISAIADAAGEARVDEKELSLIIQVVLQKLMARRVD